MRCLFSTTVTEEKSTNISSKVNIFSVSTVQMKHVLHVFNAQDGRIPLLFPSNWGMLSCDLDSAVLFSVESGRQSHNLSTQIAPTVVYLHQAG